MRILDRYIFRQTLGPLLFCLGGFVSLTIIIDLFGHLDEIFKKHVPGRVIAEYYLTFAPTIAVMTLPIAVLLTITFILGNLNHHNEITAMRASGLSVPRIIAPFVLLGLVAAAATFLANEHVVPPATLRHEYLQERYFEDSAGQSSASLREHVALLGRGNRLYYVGSYDTAAQALSDITILEHDRRQRLTAKIYAKSAQWDGQQWVFHDGMIVQLDARGNAIGAPDHFETRAMTLAESPEQFAQSDIRPELMRFFQLRAYLDQLEVTSPSAIRRLQVELAYKLAMPWTCVIMALLGVPFSLFHRGGMLTGMGMSVVLGVLYYGALALSVALGKGGALSPWVATCLPHGVFLVIAGLFFYRIR